jgi:hypothetical protein
MAFRTKLDYSDNRQIKQRERTETTLSGATVFGVPFSALTSGPDLSNIVQTSQYFGVVSTYSGNNTTTVFTWGIPGVSAVDSSISALTPSNSGVSQNISAVFGSSSTTIIDNNLVNLTYSGVSATNLYPITMSEPTPGNYTGTVSTDFFIYSAETLDFTGRTIWVDNTEILRTKKLIVSDNPQIGYVLTCTDVEGMVSWGPVSGTTSGTTYWSASTGTNAIVPVYSNSIASGINSLAEGFLTTASGNYSHAEGYNTTASGLYSHAEGYRTIASSLNSHAEGAYTQANGGTSHAEGAYTTAVGDNSHAEGVGTIASGLTSHAEGSATRANGGASHAEGSQTTATGIGSHAEGNGTRANGGASHTEGQFTTANGDISHAEGEYTTTFGDYSHAEGKGTVASGQTSHAEGSGTIAYGGASHAEGSQTTATGIGSHSEGGLTIASGLTSHAEGQQTTAIGTRSHAEGFSTTAIGDSSHTEGFRTTAIGDYSHAEGSATIAFSNHSHAGGSNSSASGITSFIHSLNSSISGARSAVIGGQNIIGTAADTVYVPDLIIDGLTSTDPIATDSNGRIVAGVSDIRLKKNINTLPIALDVIKNLRGVSFEYTEESNMGPGVRFGFIAQEVQEIVPELVRVRAKSDDMLNLNYSEIIPWIVEAIKELTLTNNVLNEITLQTQTISAEDNNIELNYNGNRTTAIGGGISVINGVNDGISAEFKLNSEGSWVTNNSISPTSLIIPEYKPSSTLDNYGKIGDVTRDDNYLYIKGGDGWKRSSLESF